MRIFWLNLIGFLVVVAVNSLANAIPLNGQTTGEISDKINVLFTPAGYVFSIWGFIYFLLLIWLLRGFKPSHIDRKVHVPFLFSCAFNATWIFLWHYEFFVLSTLVIIALLVSLIIIYSRIEREHFSFWDRFPFSVYLGWVSVAVMANISYTLTYYEWNGFGLSAAIWTILLIVLASVLAVTFRFAHRDPVYPLVFVWAFSGIAVRNWTDEPLIAFTAVGAALIVFLSCLFSRKKIVY
ncbi:tryptophan-rich sensory protein [Domibacillus indicus]|uniref:TspO/MBR family protein n=1 Tax=Domibacillus indicus TaxID=1437523 RepID=UPI002041A159|nr:TspO/MBR family protein [Domibacillus indicus]MCM3789197.1 tryptophan-rich sensory protein [Domibacillus indicus]